MARLDAAVVAVESDAAFDPADVTSEDALTVDVPMTPDACVPTAVTLDTAATEMLADAAFSPSDTADEIALTKDEPLTPVS